MGKLIVVFSKDGEAYEKVKGWFMISLLRIHQDTVQLKSKIHEQSNQSKLY